MVFAYFWLLKIKIMRIVEMIHLSHETVKFYRDKCENIISNSLAEENHKIDGELFEIQIDESIFGIGFFIYFIY